MAVALRVRRSSIRSLHFFERVSPRRPALCLLCCPSSFLLPRQMKKVAVGMLVTIGASPIAVLQIRTPSFLRRDLSFRYLVETFAPMGGFLALPVGPSSSPSPFSNHLDSTHGPSIVSLLRRVDTLGLVGQAQQAATGLRCSNRFSIVVLFRSSVYR
jgi:hypothetical protein